MTDKRKIAVGVGLATLFAGLIYALVKWRPASGAPGDFCCPYCGKSGLASLDALFNHMYSSRHYVTRGIPRVPMAMGA